MKNFIIYCLTVALAWPMHSIAQVQVSEAAKIQLATDAAEQIFFTSKLESEIVQLQKQFDGIENNGAVSTYEKIMWSGTAVLGAVAALLVYKGAKHKDIRTLFYWFFAVVFGGGAIGTGLEAAGTAAVNAAENAQQRKQLMAELTTALGKVKEAKGKAEIAMSQLRTIDPDIDTKVAQALRDNSVKIKRLDTARSQLGEAKSDLRTENMDLGLSGLFAAGSIYNVVKILAGSAPKNVTADVAAKAKKWGLIISATGVVITGAWVGKNVVERSKVVNSIDELEKSIVDIEQDYRESLISALTAQQ